MTRLSIKNKSLQNINQSSTVDCLVTALESTKFCKITQYKGHYIVQGHSRIMSAARTAGIEMPKLCHCHFFIFLCILE